MTITPTDPQLIELGSGRRLTLRLGHHDRYLASEEPDGTLILRPAVVLTEDDAILRQQEWLVDRIESAREFPESLVRRERPKKKA